MDVKKDKKEHFFRTLACILEMMSSDESTQVNGIVQLIDFTGSTMKHQTYMSMEERKSFIQTWQVTKPLVFPFLLAFPLLLHHLVYYYRVSLTLTVQGVTSIAKVAPRLTRFLVTLFAEELPHAHQGHQHVQLWSFHRVRADDRQVCHVRKDAEKSEFF